MFDYYKKSIRKIKEILKEKGYISQKEWDKYKTGKALLSSTSIMCIYCETENWETFIDKVKNDIENSTNTN